MGADEDEASGLDESARALHDHYLDLVRSLVAGRRVILAGSPLAGTTRRVAQLRELGAERCLIVANGIGTGPLPDPVDCDHVVVEVNATGTVDERRQVERVLADPPPEVTQAIAAFDPDKGALVLISAFLASGSVGGRRGYGTRRPDWIRLEDKTTCDRLFDEAAIAHPAATVAAARRDALLAAAAMHDAGAGTVWSGDARQGFNGGTEFVRWIRADATEDDVDEAVAWFAHRCDRVRVAAFVEGLPASIHGVVCDDGVAALRPVELVNLRPATGGRFRYAGCATFFDPAPVDREAMRGAASRIGAALAAGYGYRGAFTVDGILGVDGWVATEVNPRFGGGLGYVSAVLPAFPFDLLHHVLAAGDGAAVRAEDLEALVVPAADRTRWGGGWSTVATGYDTTEVTPIVYGEDGAACRPAIEGEEPEADLSVGPGAMGGFVWVALRADRTPIGPSVAPRVAAALALADERHGAGIGPLTPAVPVR